MIDNSPYLRSEKQLLINDNQKISNFTIFEEDYDIDMDTNIMLNDRIIYLNKSYNFKKYVGFNKYSIFLILKILNPFVKIQIIEGTPSNIHNIFYSKDEKHNNCIYIFYHHLTNNVTNIRYITKN